MARTILGSARVARVGCGVAPQQSFLAHPSSHNVALPQKKVRDGEDPIAGTRGRVRYLEVRDRISN
jgi:hypothetical protein